MKLLNTKEIALPIAMITGAMGFSFFHHLAPVIPYLLFCMLFIPFCKLSFNHLVISPLHRRLITAQLLLSIITYLTLQTFNQTWAQGVAICIIVPTASSAAVVTAMLGGSIATITTYALIGNLTLAILLPFALSAIGLQDDLPIWQSLLLIIKQTTPILILPLIVSQLLRHIHAPTCNWIAQRQTISFILWIAALVIVTARTVQFMIDHGAENKNLQIVLALSALFVCLVQFYIGKWIGKRYNQTIDAGQALGQKNTVMAIWIAQTYLTPLASIAPAFYVIWQNLFNSWQLWKMRKSSSLNK